MMTAGALIADRYRLLEQLPAVAPRVLWRARDEWSEQLVTAAQVPMPGLVGQEILVARSGLSREVRAAEGCQHRHMVRPTDAVLDADDLWVISEPGPVATLATVLAEHGRVEPEQAARWGRDIADGLATAHGAGVLHRDLHAGVVSLTEDGAAVVSGFAATVVTRDGLREGIPVHVAPEVARKAQASPASDIFTLAAVLYCAVEGNGPYPDSADRARLLQAAAAGALAVPKRAGRLSGLLTQMLHPDPAQRPRAAVVRDLLASPISNRPVAAGPRQPLPLGASIIASKDRRWLVLITVAVLSVLVLVIALIM